MALPNSVKVWVSDYGSFPLPDDFPFHVMRKDGWWDKRFKKDRERGEAFVEAETSKLRDQYLA